MFFRPLQCEIHFIGAATPKPFDLFADRLPRIYEQDTGLALFIQTQHPAILVVRAGTFENVEMIWEVAG